MATVVGSCVSRSLRNPGVLLLEHGPKCDDRE